MEPHDRAFERAQAIVKYLKNELSEAERKELEAWLAAHEDNRRLMAQLTDEKAVREELRFFESVSLPKAWEKIAAQTGQDEKVIPLRRKQRSLWVAAAAAVLVLVGSLMVYRLLETKLPPAEIAKQPVKVQDKAPGGNKAVLTLADGSRVILESAADGPLASQGATRVVKSGSRLAYQASPAGKGSEAVSYNTLSTPRGGQYQVALPDGSQVWLNAASSLHFPTAFAGKERVVEITGEAYFEVAKNEAMPFIVRVSGAEVRVLGTHFNVMAYADEAAVKTTLLEGAVRFASGKNTSLLRPGQQLQLTKSGQINVTDKVNVDEVVAWKNGLFHFEKADLETVMRQLSRWYDVEVEYRNKNIRHQFVAEMPRTAPLPDILKALELTSSIRFAIEGKKIVVMP